MDTATFDTLTRFVTTAATRRAALHGLAAGAATVTAGSLLHADEAAARGKKKHKKRKNSSHSEETPLENECKAKNWCVDRTQTCGPTTGYGKCLVDATGGNLCAEILFQAPTCADCAAPNCTNCRCVLAAGGGDRCNNGSNGYDFICVRAVV
jgi:hypothetical protein